MDIQVDKFLALTAMLAGFVPYGPAAGEDAAAPADAGADGPAGE